MKKFDITFRGYDKEQVDSHITELTAKYDSTLAMQKDRIFSLVDENSALKEQLNQYIIDEKAISQSLVESQKLAGELKYDAEKFAKLTLTRAKVFYASWQTYAKLLIATLSEGEVKQFNALSDKIRGLIESFEGTSDATTELDNVIATTSLEQLDNSETHEVAQSTAKTANPILRVQEVAKATIDPKELLDTSNSLEDLCKELGLIK